MLPSILYKLCKYAYNDLLLPHLPPLDPRPLFLNDFRLSFLTGKRLQMICLAFKWENISFLSLIGPFSLSLGDILVMLKWLFLILNSKSCSFDEYPDQ